MVHPDSGCLFLGECHEAQSRENGPLLAVRKTNSPHPPWSGMCSIVRLIMPITLVGPRGPGKNHPRSVRARRDRTSNWDLTAGGLTYIDAIGIPRGVPNKFKLADQVASGFESLPLISALFPVTRFRTTQLCPFQCTKTIQPNL